MKKIIVIAVMSITFAMACMGQKSQSVEGQNVIEINPFGTDGGVEKIKKGQIVKFRINNVNTFKVNAHTTSQTLNHDFSVVSNVLNQYIKGQMVVEDADRLNSDLIHEKIIIDEDEDEELIINQINETDKKFVEELYNFITTYNNIHRQTALEDILLDQINDSIFISDTLVLKNNIDNDYFAVYNKSLNNPKNEIVNNLDKLAISYFKLKDLYDERDNSSQKDFSEEMAFAKKTFEEISDIKIRNEIIKKAQSAVSWYNKIKSATFVAYTNGEQLYDDIVIIKPTLKYSNGSIAHEFNPITIETYGRIKVNFSSGYFLSFIGDDNYSIYKDSAGNTVGVLESNKNNLTHSLGGMVHAYKDCINDVDFGLSVGASLANNGKLGFYFGGSIFFLEKNRLVLTGGFSFLNIKKLNTSNLNLIDKDINRYEFVSNTDTEIKYDDIFKRAWFIGVTYNLAK